MKKFIAAMIAIFILFGVGVYFSDRHLNTDILASIGITKPKPKPTPEPPIIIETYYTVVFVKKDNSVIESLKKDSVINFETINDNDFIGWSKTNSSNDLILDLTNETATDNTVYYAVYKEPEIPAEKEYTVVTYIIGSDYSTVLLERNKSISASELKNILMQENLLKDFNDYPEEYNLFDDKIILSNIAIHDLATYQELERIDTTQTALVIIIDPQFKLENYNYGLIIEKNNEVFEVIKTNNTMTYGTLSEFINESVYDALLESTGHIAGLNLLTDPALQNTVLENGIYKLRIYEDSKEEIYRIEQIATFDLYGNMIFVNNENVPYYETQDFNEMNIFIDNNIFGKFESIFEFAQNNKIAYQMYEYLNYEDITPLFNTKFTSFDYDQHNNRVVLNYDFHNLKMELDILNNEEENNELIVRQLAVSDINGNIKNSYVDMMFKSLQELENEFNGAILNITERFGMRNQVFGELSNDILLNFAELNVLNVNYNQELMQVELNWDWQAAKTIIENQTTYALKISNLPNFINDSGVEFSHNISEEDFVRSKDRVLNGFSKNDFIITQILNDFELTLLDLLNYQTLSNWDTSYNSSNLLYEIVINEEELSNVLELKLKEDFKKLLLATEWEMLSRQEEEFNENTQVYFYFDIDKKSSDYQIINLTNFNKSEVIDFLNVFSNKNTSLTNILEFLTDSKFHYIGEELIINSDNLAFIDYQITNKYNYDNFSNKLFGPGHVSIEIIISTNQLNNTHKIFSLINDEENSIRETLESGEKTTSIHYTIESDYFDLIVNKFLNNTITFSVNIYDQYGNKQPQLHYTDTYPSGQPLAQIFLNDGYGNDGTDDHLRGDIKVGNWYNTPKILTTSDYIYIEIVAVDNDPALNQSYVSNLFKYENDGSAFQLRLNIW